MMHFPPVTQRVFTSVQSANSHCRLDLTSTMNSQRGGPCLLKSQRIHRFWMGRSPRSFFSAATSIFMIPSHDHRMVLSA